MKRLSCAVATFYTCFFLILSFGPSVAYAAEVTGQDRLFTLAEAIQGGLKQHAEMTEAKALVTQKQIELTQAREARKNQAEKDSSLFAKDHNLEKDIEIRMKIPTAEKELAVAKRNLEAKTIAVTYEVETKYYTVVQSKLGVEQAIRELNAAKQQMNEVKVKQSYALADQDEAEEAQEAVDAAASQLKQAQLTYKSDKISLGELIGVQLEIGFTFVTEPDYTVLTQDAMWRFVQHAERQDAALFAAVAERKIAEEKVNVTGGLYSSKFGSGVTRAIEAMVAQQNMNFELYMANYSAMLAVIDVQWDGIYWLLGFIPIPKKLLQGEFDGTRYFDDAKYSLPLSIMELNKAKLKEQAALKALHLKVKQSYLDAKKAEEAYAQTLQKHDKMKQNLEAAKQKRQIDSITSDELKQVNDQVAAAEKNVVSNQFAYRSAIAKLDSDTSKAVQPYIMKGILPYKTIDDGLEALDQEPITQSEFAAGTWSVIDKVGTLVSEFSIEVDKELGATGYALFTSDGKQLSEIIPLKQKSSHLAVVFGDAGKLIVKLYNSEEQIAKATLEGFGTSGTVQIELAQGQLTKMPVNSGQDNALGNPHSKLANGSLIIGTYVVDAAALTTEVLTIAIQSATASGQGIYFRSALADGVWINLAKSTDVGDLLGSNSSSAVSAKVIDDLNLTVRIDASGNVINMLTVAQLGEEIAALNNELEQLQAQNDAAVDAGKLDEVTRMQEQIAMTEAQITLKTALLAGDSEQAKQAIAKYNNPNAEADPADDPQSLEQLQADIDQLESELNAVAADGNTKQAATLIDQWINLNLSLSDAGREASTELETLMTVADLLKQAYAVALQESDSDHAAQLEVALSEVEAQLAVVQKAELWLTKSALEQMITGLSELKIVADQISDRIATQLAIIFEQLKHIEKQKYTSDELDELGAAGQKIMQSAQGEITILPVEDIIVLDHHIKLTVPPVEMSGNIYIQLKPIAESFGFDVLWNETDFSISLSRDHISIICYIDKDFAFVNGEKIILEEMPLLLADRTVVSLTFINQLLNIEAKWQSEAKVIIITD